MTLQEGDLKRTAKDYLDIKNIFSYHNLQGIGCYAGLPDRVIHVYGKVVYLEIKTEKGKLSPAQKEFKEQCERDGIPYLVVRSIEELMELIDG